MPSISCHVAFDVHEASQVGEVRRAATRIAEGAGFDEAAVGRVALVVTELGTNLVRHAQRGRLLIAAVDNDLGETVVEVLSLDQGPGIANIAGSLLDGYSTGGTPGTGLGAVRRQANEFDIFSTVPGGTVVLARIGERAPRHTGAAPSADAGPRLSPFQVGAVALAAPGEVVCGDAWHLVRQGARAALIVADGLGHGPYAAEASVAAVESFVSAPFSGPAPLLENAHARLRTTRGAAVAIADLDMEAQTLVFGGAGNIMGRLISGLEDRTLLSQNGTVGLQIARIQEMRYAWPAHALLVMHSDGLTTRWKLDGAESVLQHHPAIIAAWLMREHCRGRDDATVVVVKRRYP